VISNYSASARPNGDRIQTGLLEHKITTVERSDGSAKTVEQVLVTAKGLAKLSEVLQVEPLPI